VHLKGVVDCYEEFQTASCDPGLDRVIFVLPPGFRPAERAPFPSLSGQYPGNTAARIDVDVDGRVIDIAGDPTVWITLDGITFRAA